MSPNVASNCPKCGFQHPGPIEVCAKCGVIFARFNPDNARVETGPTRIAFQHATAVLRFKEKGGLVASRKDLLEGLEDESMRHLVQLGMAGWELVSAVPYSSGGASFSVTGSANRTDAVLAFFKRALDAATTEKAGQIQPGKIHYSEGWWRTDGPKRYGPYATREEAETTPPA